MTDEDELSSGYIKIPESVTDAAISVSVVASNVSSSVGEVVGSISSSVGDVVHNVTSGMKRIMTSPPQTLETQDLSDTSCESPGILTSTPKITRAHKHSPSTESLGSELSGRDAESLIEMEAAIDIEIGITEDYFSKPEDCVADISEEGLEASINKCKELILDCDGNTSRRRTLVHRLVQLRLCYERVKEEAELCKTGVQVVMGHQLLPQHPPFAKSSKQYCDKCAQIIWGVLHVSYVCKLCDFRCHGRCLKGIRRKCASLRLEESPHYILRICPEVGLSKQNYRCAECAAVITNTHRKGIGCIADAFTQENAWAEPRRCDYTGHYYCPVCHWNSQVILPSRVVHNWDFEERSVSRQAKQLLVLMMTKPILDIEVINPYLFRFVNELNTAKQLRKDIILMKQYLTTCRVAQEKRLLRQLEERQHFVDNCNMYSLQDLIHINSGTLLDFLDKIHLNFYNHIKNDCLICQGKGYICEICQTSEVIYPFDSDIVSCDECLTVYHQKCFNKDTECPRCLRQKTRKLKVSSVDDL